MNSLEKTAQELLRYTDNGSLWPAALQASLPESVAEAYQLALVQRRLRLERGDVSRGFKIGFTNRNIWPVYGVFGPIWGTVYDRTLTFCDGAGALNLSHRCQPRLEPELVFGMKAAPPPAASLDALFDCIDWVALGFEIVQSHAPGWKFNAAMTVADGGLHSHLLVGARQAVRSMAHSAQAFNAAFSSCQVALNKNGATVERGKGSHVLDGPLFALHHFLDELRLCPGAPALAAGDVVTTGTWTDAWPVAPGETWLAAFDAPLGALSITFS
jgi:2-keto-4-pentenoate hydratase